MSAVLKLFSSGVRQVTRDGMLLLLLPAPFFMAAALRIILPIADSILTREAGFSLNFWYPLSDAFVIAMTPIMVAVVCAFLMLDERDEGIGVYYRITPAGGRAYLAARLGLPMVWAFISTLIVIILFALALADAAVILTTAVIGIFQGIIACMLLVVLAGNKVEGLALSKLTNFFIIGLPAAWFISSPYKYVFGFLPSFWMGEIVYTSAVSGSAPFLLYGAAGILSSLLWTAALTRAFLYKTS
jgi:fluoroquinolone transport system permease protein